MPKSLNSFSFDKVKAGQILRRYLDDADISQRQAAPLLGMTDDMLSNVLRGQNKEISFERVFKICTLSGRSLCEFLRDMLEGEDVDFADRVRAFCADPAHSADSSALHGVSVRKTEVIAQKTEIIEEKSDPLFKSLGPDVLAFLRADRQEQAERANLIHDTYTHMLLEQCHDQIQQLKDAQLQTVDHYEKRIAAMEKEEERRLADQKEKYTSVTDYLKKENIRLRKLCTRLAIAFGIETAAVVGLFTYDALNHNVGWFRGYMPYFGSSDFFSFKG